MYKIPDNVYKDRLSYLSDKLEINEFVNQPVRT